MKLSNSTIQMENLLKSAESKKIISFDFFDTLFIRTVINPEDVFDIVSRRSSFKKFREFRQLAQANAFIKMHQQGKKEITILDIYENFHESSVPYRLLRNYEIETELAVIHPNLELIDIFNYFRSSGKIVVITSDMYFPHSFFEKILQKYNIFDVQLFISADCNATKRDYGELFDILIDNFRCDSSEILHIGDNPIGDIKKAIEKNISAFHYTETNKPILQGDYSIEASISAGLIRKLKHKITVDSYEDIGFKYGGPAAYGYFKWLRREFIEDKVDKVLFMSRDGYLLYKIMKEQKLEIAQIDAHYFFGSRTAFKLASINEHNFNENLDFLLSGAEGLNAHELLTRIGVSSLDDEILSQIGLPDQYSPIDRPIWESFLLAYRNEILKICNRNRIGLMNYLHQLEIKDYDSVALVDIGWNGTSLESFAQAVKGLMDLRLIGYNLCLTDQEKCIYRREHYNLKAFYTSEIFSPSTIEAIYSNRVFAELIFSAPHNTVIGWELNSNNTVDIIQDNRSDLSEKNSCRSEKIAYGVSECVQQIINIEKELKIDFCYKNMLNILLSFMLSNEWQNLSLIQQIVDFDDWGYTENKSYLLMDY